MFTFGLRSGTGTGDNVYLTGCVDVDVDLLLAEVDMQLVEQNINVEVEQADIAIVQDDYGIDIGEAEHDVDITVEIVGVDGGC